MLQVFYMNVAKVDRHVAMAIHICRKRLFKMFHLFFLTYVANVFIWMLHMFHTYVANIFIWMLHMFFARAFQVFSDVFASVSHPCFKCFICLKTHVASVSSLAVSKVDRVLLLWTHLPQFGRRK
jgi:hypothetical protein